MQWFKRWLFRLDSKRKLRELEEFVSNLRSGSDDALAELMVAVTDVRHSLARAGIDVLRPFELVTFNGQGMTVIYGTIERLRKSPGHPLRVAYMVWAHTARASNAPALLPLANDMWRELRRGLPGIEEAKARIVARGASPDINISDAANIPRLV